MYVLLIAIAGSLLFITSAIVAHIPKFITPLLDAFFGFLLSSYTKPALRVANLTRSLVQARRRMPATDRVSP